MASKKQITIHLMQTVIGTTTATEGIALFLAMDKILFEGNKIKLSLHKSPPLSTSFLNSSFGELYDKYGYSSIRENITLIDYLPSQAKKIKDYLNSLQELA